MPTSERLPDELDDETLLDLYDYGWSPSDISDEYPKHSRHQIYRMLRDLGVDTSRRNQIPRTGPTRKLWEMDPDEIPSSTKIE